MTDRPSIVLRSLKDIQEVEKRPLQDRNLPSSTYQLLEQGAAISPDKAAIRYLLRGTHYHQSHDYSFTELMGHIRKAANAFHALGIGSRDVISYLLPNLPQTYFSMIGGETAGIINPINPLLEAEVIAGIMNAAGSRILVTLGPLPKTDIWQKAVAVSRLVPTLEKIVVVNLQSLLPLPLRWMGNIAGSIIRRRVGEPAVPVVDYEDATKHQRGDRLIFQRDISPDDIASLFHTGGTTGIPKLAQRTHFNEVSNAWSETLLLENPQEKTVFCGLPLFHNGGFNASTLGPLSAGVTLVVGSPMGWRGPGIIPNFWKIAEHYRLNSFIGVPAVYAALLNVPVNADISTLEFALCGAALLPVEVYRRFEKNTGLRIVEGYGLTEATSLCTANLPYGERKVGSIGLRFVYQEIKAVHLDDQQNILRECNPGESGVLIVRGPNCFAGYVLEQHNEGIWVKSDDGGPAWLNTGDLGYVDEDGFYFINGRMKEVIIRGGHNIDPKLIEEPLYAHPAVLMAAAIGRPDALVGEVPVVYVQLKENTRLTEDELLAYLREKIGERAAIPKAVYFIGEMPMTAVGKVFKPALLDMEIKRVYTREIQQLNGVSSVLVEVCEEMRSGKMVKIEITLDSNIDAAVARQQIEEKLSYYPYRYQLITGY
jgi:fatty-acyl-CoA synthase